MELINIHTHTYYCGHGTGTVEEVCESAERAQISTLALTEHYPLSPQRDPDEYLSMPVHKLDEYCKKVLTAREHYPHREILLGCEFDWLGDYEDRIEDEIDLSYFDLVLGSVHFIDGWAFDDPAMRGQWDVLGPDAIWKRYFEIWHDAVASDLPFTIMAHPDLPKKFGIYPSFDLIPLYKQAAEAVRESGRMIEVNTSGAHYACAEMYPAPRFLAEFCRAGVPCTVGSDAHVPENVSRGIKHAYRILYESGYREVTVPTISGDRRSITIE